MERTSVILSAGQWRGGWEPWGPGRSSLMALVRILSDSVGYAKRHCHLHDTANGGKGSGGL